MFSASFSSGRVNNMLKKFTADTEADLPKINVAQLAPGSEAFIIETGKTYILNNNYKWVEKINNGGTPGPRPDVEYIYDGGEIL